MTVGDAYVFPGFLTPVLTQLFFPKPQTTFLTCFCRGERRKYAGKKSLLNRGSNSQPPGHEADMLSTEPPVLDPGFYTSAVKVFRKHSEKRRNCSLRAISPFPTVFSTFLENFLPFSSNLKFLSVNSFSLEESKIHCLGKG